MRRITLRRKVLSYFAALLVTLIVAKVSGNTLIATSRFSRESRARYTSPIPLLPSGPTISYVPSFVPALNVMVWWRDYTQFGV